MPYLNQRDKNKSALNRYYSRRAEAIRILGSKCIKCDSTSGLEIDHIDPITKEYSIAKCFSLNRETFLKEIDKCQLLCSPCHKEKTKSQRKPLSHGRWRYLRDKCRCKICTEDYSKYRRYRYRLTKQ